MHRWYPGRDCGDLFTAEIAEDAEMNVNERASAGSSMIFLNDLRVLRVLRGERSDRRYETQY